MPQTAGCPIAGIGKHFLSAGGERSIQRFELAPAHVHFSPHFQALGHGIGHGPSGYGNGKRYAADGAHMRCDVFSLNAIAARGSYHQLPFHIGQCQRQPVDLQLDRQGRLWIFHACILQPLHTSLVPGADFFFVKCIPQRQQRFGMTDLFELVHRGPTHPPGW